MVGAVVCVEERIATVLCDVVSCVTSVRCWLLVVSGEVAVVPAEVVVISGAAVVVSWVVERFAETGTERATCIT